ncbi:MAG: O-antigen ligase family protein [Streptosporangiaceae bacterium]|jgi:O-antigen ligase/polysaccharide polymerase Wzy-like membrane protein
MSLSVTAFRQRRVRRPPDTVQDRERWARRKVGIAWALLFLNALTFYPGLSFVHIPSAVGKGITQSALVAAFFVALTVNRHIILRPNVFLCLVSILAIEAFFTLPQAQHFGTVYRTFRLAGFVTTLWLLTPWWGRRDMLLVRCHLATLLALLSSVLLGLLVSPGHALFEGRLSGAIWPIPSTEVAHYTAITIGLVIVLWFCGHLRGRVTLVVIAVAFPTLVLTHTRTALAAMVAAILVAGLSLLVAKARVRKLFIAGAALAVIVISTLSGVLTTWLARGEGTHELTDLTGRTLVWGELLSFPRDKFQEIFGFGLSNASFNGLSIDSNWYASYQDQGLFGVAVCATILLFLLVTAYFQPRGVRRALALFLVTYCLVASFTEVGFTDVSPYMLDLTVAASLLVPAVTDREPP